jgi:hypothetical protein
MKKHHYVYHSFEEWGRDYIGIRSCDCLPEEDTRYFGSFKDKTFKPTGKNILFVCETRQEVAEIEIILHDFFDVAVNPKFANRSKQTSTKFDTTGVLHTEETKRKKSEANSGVPKSDEWKQAMSKRMSGENHPMYGRTGEKNPLFGVPRTEEWKKANSGENHPLFGVPRTEAQKKAQSEKMSGEKHPNYGNTGALSPCSKAIIAIEPDGTERRYGSIIDAVRDAELGISAGHLRKLLKTGKSPRWGKFKGWQFFYKNSEDS